MQCYVSTIQEKKKEIWQDSLYNMLYSKYVNMYIRVSQKIKILW